MLFFFAVVGGVVVLLRILGWVGPGPERKTANIENSISRQLPPHPFHTLHARMCEEDSEYAAIFSHPKVLEARRKCERMFDALEFPECEANQCLQLMKKKETILATAICNAAKGTKFESKMMYDDVVVGIQERELYDLQKIDSNHPTLRSVIEQYSLHASIKKSPGS